MQRGNFSEALEDLQKTHEMFPSDADTLINLAASSLHAGKEQEANEFIDILQKQNPSNPVVEKLELLAESFATFDQ